VGAWGGPFGNYRLGFIDRDPSSGSFELVNLVHSDIVSPEWDYSLGATMLFREGRRFENFETPHLGGLYVHLEDVIDVGDALVIDPGYIVGDVFLASPPGELLPAGSCLESLVFSDDIDGDGVITDRSFNRTSMVRARGSWTVAEGAMESSFGGLARVQYDGTYNAVDSAWEGDYELVVGGLYGEPSYWVPDFLRVTCGHASPGLPEGHHDSYMNITDNTVGEILVLPGETASVPRRYCVSQVSVHFRAGAGTFYDPRLSAAGAFQGRDFEWRASDYRTTVTARGTPSDADDASDEGLVVLCLPEGLYSLSPSVRAINPGGGTSTVRLPPFQLFAGCRQLIEATTDLVLSLDPLLPCSAERTTSISGTVQSVWNVTRIAWSLNGGPEEDACTNCGEDPAFSFDVTLADCVNSIHVRAVDQFGAQASVTAFTRFDTTPPEMEGCADRTVHSADPSGARVDLDVTAEDGCDGPVAVSCDPPSGSFFPMGPTVVRCQSEADACGNYAVCAMRITVEYQSRPPVADAGPDRALCLGEQPVLGGLPTATDGTPPYTYLWEPAAGLDDPSLPNPTATLAGDIVYTVTVRDANDLTDSDPVSLSLLLAPVAAFDPPAGPLCQGQLACFEDRSTGAESWEWTFGADPGDGSSARHPCYVYPEPGAFDVSLTVTNRCGSDTANGPVEVGPVPRADFTYSTSGRRLCVGNTVDFTNLSSTDVVSWQWDFGDGTGSDEEDPSHAYDRDGVYLVRLVACNDCGCGPPHFEVVEIAASCNTNCEANSNQIGCASGLALVEGNTCADHDSFNTTSYPCAPGRFYSGENKIYDLNFTAGSNFRLRLVETAPEPNGYDLDVMISTACNPPECAAWGDELVVFGDRTERNDDYFVIVDGREGTCGPFRLEVACLDADRTGPCAPPVFGGIAAVGDADVCSVSGIQVEWELPSGWGAGLDGVECPDGVFEVWRAPADDPAAEHRVGTAGPGETSFVDAGTVPGREYLYRVHATNHCCAEAAVTGAALPAVEPFIEPLDAEAGPDLDLSCSTPSGWLTATFSGGAGIAYEYAWSPTEGLTDPAALRPEVLAPGLYELTVTDRETGCRATDTVRVTADPALEAREPSAVDLRPGDPPLRVVREPGGDVRISWEDVGAGSYRLESGSLGDLSPGSSGSAAVLCGLPGPECAFVRDPGSRFYLARAEGCTGLVSSAGRDSEGEERIIQGDCR